MSGSIRTIESWEIMIGYILIHVTNVYVSYLLRVCLFIWGKVYSLSCLAHPSYFSLFIEFRFWCTTPISGWPVDTQDPHPLHGDSSVVHVQYFWNVSLRAKCISYLIFEITIIGLTVYM